MSNLLYRIGSSYDIHQLVEGGGFKLGGIYIKCPYKIIAHSDGDVVFHALSEAILGSLALGDLGKFFPPEDDKYLNMDSSKILLFTFDKLKEKGYEINNIDLSIILEKPKLKTYIDEIRINISKLLNIEFDQISLKAMTNEKMDSLGQNKAVSCFATILIKKIN